MVFPLPDGVKDLKCQKCGKKYKVSEFGLIMEEVSTGRVDFPRYRELLVCFDCWSKKYHRVD
jgi:hypothetical protein